MRVVDRIPVSAGTERGVVGKSARRERGSLAKRGSESSTRKRKTAKSAKKSIPPLIFVTLPSLAALKKLKSLSVDCTHMYQCFC
jgi:hypothetical protein